MAVTLLFKKTKAKIDSLELDAAVSEQHQTSVDVTEHPVEQGANIVDHRRRKPDVLTIEGLISNTPLPGPQAPLETQTYRGQEFQARSSYDIGRVGSAYQQLLDLADSSKLLTVVTALRTYDNMTLTELNVPRDAKIGESLRFTATFRNIRIVQSQTVQLQARTTRAKKKEDLSKKAPKKDEKPPVPKTLAKFGKDEIMKVLASPDPWAAFSKLVTPGG